MLRPFGALGVNLISRNRIELQRPLIRVRELSFTNFFKKFKKIPQPPGYVVGTVNDAYKPPEANFYEGGYHWTYERFVTICLVPLTLTPFAAGVNHPMVDSLLSVLLLIHCHTGFESCIIDYIPKRVYGIWHKIAIKLLTMGTFVGIYGIYLLETTGNGLFDLIKSIWTA